MRFLIKPFSETELYLALKKTSNSAPGADDIHYSMLSNLSKTGKTVLLNLYNEIWSRRMKIPEDWRVYTIIPILKPGKSSKNWDSYRPIGLASCILKTYERLIKNRLEFWLEKNDLLPKSQFGFRKGKSTQESLSHLLIDIYSAFTYKRAIGALFLDIKGAYDNVNLNILYAKMLEIGIPETVTGNIVNLYTNRAVHVRLNGDNSKSRYTSLGLPQGSILSPLLYILYTADLENILPQHIKVLQYADDIAIYVENKSIDNCNNYLKSALNIIIKWALDKNLTISESKSTVVTFTRKRYSPPNYLQFDNYNIPYKSSKKFLGVFLDSKLNWKEHTNYILRRTENAMNIIKTVSISNWGADPNVSILLYRNLIRSTLDYGSIFYGSASNSVLQKIERIKNKALRLSTGYLRSTPILVMECELNEPPLFLRREYLSEKFISKVAAKDKLLLKKIVQLTTTCLTHYYWQKRKELLVVESFLNVSSYIDDIHQIEQSSTRKLNYEDYLSPFKCHFSNILETDFLTKLDHLQYVQHHWGSYQKLYTDGSKMNGKVGYAVFYPQKSIKINNRLPDKMTTFTAELIAVKEAYKICMNQKELNYVIFTDCQSIVQKLKYNIDHFVENYIICDIIALNSEALKTGRNIILCWIKAHIGIKDNEIVDDLAKKATMKDFAEQIYQLPMGDLIHMISSLKRMKWQEHYNNSDKGIYYKNIQPTLSVKTWFKQFSNRGFIKTICRIRSDHSMTPVYKRKIGMSNNDECICGELADLQHMLLECPLHFMQISNFYAKLVKVNVQLPSNLPHLLESRNVDVYKILYNHINCLKLKL